jgi:ATP-dependent protease HslVU (ClpYQ) peptidase subunit
VTTLAAIQGDGWVAMGGDSQITVGETKFIGSSTPKVIVKDKYLLALSGVVRATDIATYQWKMPAFGTDVDPCEHMGTKVIPSLQATLEKCGFVLRPGESDFAFLLAFANTLFFVGGDLAFYQSARGIYALGTGGDLVLGFLHAKGEAIFKTVHAGRRAVYGAIEAAAVYDINTCEPITVITQGS